MSVDGDLFLNSTGKTKSIYQQSSTGEKHVLFYPTSSLPAAIDVKDHKDIARKLQKQVFNQQVVILYYKDFYILRIIAFFN